MDTHHMIHTHTQHCVCGGVRLNTGEVADQGGSLLEKRRVVLGSVYSGRHIGQVLEMTDSHVLFPVVRW